MVIKAIRKTKEPLIFVIFGKRSRICRRFGKRGITKYCCQILGGLNVPMKNMCQLGLDALCGC